MKSIVKSEVNAVVSQEKVLTFVERYRLSIKKTAESILELADVVYSAKTELSKDEFTQFRVQIDADASKDSYIKKLCVIASNASRFEPIKDKLPASYTTLYSLANIEQSKFDEVLQKNIISPKMTAFDLSSCVNRQKLVIPKSFKSMKDSQSVNFTLDIRNVDKTTVIKVIYEIAEVCKMFNIHYECDSASVTKSKVAQDVAFEERLAA
jgi:hypothetical protein